ncbi:MAG: hypothetical protein IJY15_03145 [Thermoguttaceae bacterium]|nr:hypothetical protein [Thermoguttaceae bacterium]
MSKNIENRRAFFKKVAQTALAVPFLAVAAKEAVAETPVGPSAGCSESGCTGTCKDACYKTCFASCKDSCRDTCKTGCFPTCKGTCENSCRTGCFASGIK